MTGPSLRDATNVVQCTFNLLYGKDDILVPEIIVVTVNNTPYLPVRRYRPLRPGGLTNKSLNLLGRSCDVKPQKMHNTIRFF